MVEADCILKYLANSIYRTIQLHQAYSYCNYQCCKRTIVFRSLELRCTSLITWYVCRKYIILFKNIEYLRFRCMMLKIKHTIPKMIPRAAKAHMDTNKLYVTTFRKGSITVLSVGGFSPGNGNIVLNPPKFP